MKTYTIYIFRHGITKGNINAQYIGHTDYPLTSSGIEELKKIKAKNHYPAVDAVFCSPLKRALQSAEIMFPSAKPLVIEDLIEYNFGEFEERTAEELKNNEEFAAWLTIALFFVPVSISPCIIFSNARQTRCENSALLSPKGGRLLKSP